MWYTGRMALLKQIMNRKRANNANGRSRSGDRSGISPGNDNRNSVQMTETRIYVGLMTPIPKRRGTKPGNTRAF